MEKLPARPADTERLVFGRWQIDDLALARPLWGDAQVMRYLGGPFSDDAIRARLRDEVDQEREHGLQYWPVFTRAGDPVGCCGLCLVDGTVVLGFHLREAHWGKGLAFEAAASARDLAFGSLGAAEVYAGHHPENAGSRRVLERLGFSRIGLRFYPPTGLDHPWYRAAASVPQSRSQSSSAQVQLTPSPPSSPGRSLP